MVLNKNIYSSRFPEDNNDYLKKLSEELFDSYLDLYEGYSKYLYNFLEKKLNLSKIDDEISNDKVGFAPVKKEDLDMYQLLSIYRNIYIRNNLYIERLNQAEMKYLSNIVVNDKKYDDEIGRFISFTYKKVIYQMDNPKVKVNYGPPSIETFYVPATNLVLGYRVDDIKLGSAGYGERIKELDSYTPYIIGKTLGKLDVGISVIRYDSTCVKKIGPSNSKYVEEIVDAVTPILIEGIEPENQEAIIESFRETLLKQFKDINIPINKYDEMLKIEIDDMIKILKSSSLEDKKNLYLTDEAFESIVNIANIASERAITKDQTGALSDTLKVTAYKNKLDLLLNKVKAYNILNANQLANEAKDDLDFSAGLSDTLSLKTSHYIKKSNSK